MLQWGLPKRKSAQRAWDAQCGRFREMAKRHKKRNSAHRAAIYLDMQEVAQSKVVIDRDPDLKRAALLSLTKANGWPKARVQSKNFRLTNELVGMAIGAETRASRQLAAKRGQIIDLLLEDGVYPKDFAKEIKRRGGLEKILLKRRLLQKKRATESIVRIVLELSPAHYEKLKSASNKEHISVVARKIAKRRLQLVSFNPLGSSLTEDQMGDWD
jgi:hypothetical protein